MPAFLCPYQGSCRRNQEHSVCHQCLEDKEDRFCISWSRGRPSLTWDTIPNWRPCCPPASCSRPRSGDSHVWPRPPPGASRAVVLATWSSTRVNPTCSLNRRWIREAFKKKIQRKEWKWTFGWGGIWPVSLFQITLIKWKSSREGGYKDLFSLIIVLLKMNLCRVSNI